MCECVYCENNFQFSTVSFPQPMFSVTPSLATNANAAAAAAAAFNPYLGPVSPGLMPADILPSAPVLVTSNPSVPVPAAAAAAAQKLMRTDRLEVRTACTLTNTLAGINGENMTT